MKKLFYCIPEKLLNKAYDKLDEECAKNEGFNYSGIITYDEDLHITVCGKRIKSWRKIGSFDYITPALGYQKLYLEQRLAIARLGCIKTIKEKKKVIDLQKLNNEVSAEQEEMIEEIIDVETKEESLF